MGGGSKEAGKQGFVKFFVAILERGLREPGFRGVRVPFPEHARKQGEGEHLKTSPLRPF